MNAFTEALCQTSKFVGESKCPNNGTLTRDLTSKEVVIFILGVSYWMNNSIETGKP